MRAIVVAAALMLSGCASFKLGAALYCPHGQQCTLQTGPPAMMIIERTEPKKPAAEV